jgi:hypothetical protein
VRKDLKVTGFAEVTGKTQEKIVTYEWTKAAHPKPLQMG